MTRTGNERRGVRGLVLVASAVIALTAGVYGWTEWADMVDVDRTPDGNVERADGESEDYGKRMDRQVERNEDPTATADDQDEGKEYPTVVIQADKTRTPPGTAAAGAGENVRTGQSQR